MMLDATISWSNCRVNTQEFHVGQIKHHGPPKESITLPKTNIASQAPIWSEAKKGSVYQVMKVKLGG